MRRRPASRPGAPPLPSCAFPRPGSSAGGARFPPLRYADSLRRALKMPVLDAITLVDFFHSAVTDNPVFGIDFHKVEEEAKEEVRRASQVQ